MGISLSTFLSNELDEFPLISASSSINPFVTNIVRYPQKSVYLSYLDTLRTCKTVFLYHVLILKFPYTTSTKLHYNVQFI